MKISSEIEFLLIVGPSVFFCDSRFVGLKIANRRFEAICANRWHVMKIRLLFYDLIRGNRVARIALIRVANGQAI